MRHTVAIFCLVIGVTVVRAASISGSASLDQNSFSVGGSLAFPTIPGITTPVRSFFGLLRPSISSSNSNSNSNNNGNGTSNSNSSALLSAVRNLFDLPDSKSLIPDFSSFLNSSNLGSFSFPGLENFSNSSLIPGVSTALQEARDRVSEALQLGSNFTAGIQQAIQDAFDSDDPAAALRDIVEAIIDAYVSVAENCPLFIVGSRVIQEGVRLAIEVARSAQNVITGTTAASA